MATVLVAICCVIVVARSFGTVFQKMGQPRVVGEIIAGIIFGPSCLGQIFPDVKAALFPPTVLPILTALADLGIIIYMFLVGLELNVDQLKSQARPMLIISQSSIAFPFLCGAAMAIWLYADYAPAAISRSTFALFIGIATAMTAFPVLARILADRKLDKTDLGKLTLNCAAFGDIVAWCLLAFVVGLAKADVSGAVQTVLLSVPYILGMFLIVQPLLKRYFADENVECGLANVGWIWMGVLISAMTTEAIGIHAIFGAFLFGLLMPHDGSLAASLRNKMHDFVTYLLVPIFFACTGLKTQLGLLADLKDWLVCGAIILVATGGKLCGTILAARFAGLDWRSSSIVGFLMNTRGLMEVIVLNIGLQLGILSPTLFAMFVLMALVTTFMTVPALQLMRGSNQEAQIMPGQRA